MSAKKKIKKILQTKPVKTARAKSKVAKKSNSKNIFQTCCSDKHTICVTTPSWLDGFGIHPRQFVFLIIAMVFLSILDIGLFFYSANLKSGAVILPTAQSGPIIARNYKAESVYRNLVHNIFKKYNNLLSNTDLGYNVNLAVKNIQNELLNVTVPSFYRNLHLDLIISFNLIEQGLLGDALKIESGKAKLKRIQAQYPWINRQR